MSDFKVTIDGRDISKCHKADLLAALFVGRTPLQAKLAIEDELRKRGLLGEPIVEQRAEGERK